MPMITLTFADGDRVTLAARSDETILAAARRAGVALSSDCEIGDCQTCRANCVSGTVEYDELSSVSLSDSEIEAGEILPCVAMAAIDLEIRLSYERGRLIATKPFSIRIESIEPLGGSAVTVTARVLGLTPLKFLPGQYIHLQVPGTTEWRSYSMANAPGEQRILQFFVRVLDDGVMSRYLTDRAAQDDVVHCRGPQGTFYLRSGTRPILMVAGGTGVAPMMSMLRQMAASEAARKITLCFGVTDARDLFLVEELKDMTQNLVNLDVRIAATRGERPVGIGSGLVTDLIGPESLADTDIYLCGPPAMTDHARTIVANRGAAAPSIFSERFVPST